MPNKGHRSAYPVVTGVVTFLALFSAASVIIKRSIPLPDEGPLAHAQEDYLRAGSRLPYKFRPLNRETLAEAKRLQKPLLVMVGSAGSQSARQADAAGFKDLELAALIRARYIVCRVDSLVEPTLVTAYLPISRGRLGYDLGLQVFFLDPNGELYFHRTTDRPGDSWDVDAVATILKTAQQKLDEKLANASNPSYRSLADVHEFERNVLLDPNQGGIPDLADASGKLLQSMDARTGGWNRPWGNKLMPLAWEFLLEAGRREEVERNLTPILSSGLVDWVDGGFFTQSREPGTSAVEFDKSAEINGQMAQLCAKLYSLTGRARYKILAEATFDYLANTLKSEIGIIRAFQIGDPLPLGRSDHASVKPRMLRERFSASERERLESLLNLRVPSNPQMLPIVTDLDKLERNPEAYFVLIDRIRDEASDRERKFATLTTCSTAAYATARLLQTARTLDDSERMAVAGTIYQDLSRFTVEEPDVEGIVDLRHCPDLTRHVPTVLADYLGFADASLQFFLTSRAEFALRDGMRVLDIALHRFNAGVFGVLFTAHDVATDDLPPGTQCPEIVDTDQPAANALAMGLAFDYATAMKHCKGQELTSVRSFADSALNQFGEVAGAIPLSCAAYFAVAQRMDRDTVVLYNGSDRTEVAKAKARIPLTLLLPTGRPSIQGRYEVWVKGKLRLKTDDVNAAARAVAE